MTLGENSQPKLACLDEEALKDITAPANLNSGELQDVYRLQTDDFDEPETLEVFYNDGRGGTLREIVFVDPIYADRRPRICVSIDGIQAMHKTISTLTRKVDNLVDTLQRCRGAYYKELSMLREQLYQQALAYRDGRGVQSQAATLFDPSAYISQTESEVEMQVKKKTEVLSTRVSGLEVENLRLKKRVAILSIEVTHLENQLATRGQKVDLREMCSDILDRAKIDTVIRTLRGLIEEHQQDGFYNVLEEVLSDHRGLKISELLKQNQEDAEKISKLGLELLKAKQDLATALREEKQASEALTQTTKMWQNADSMSKDLEQSLEDANNELADVKEQVDALRKEPGFLREKMTQMKEEHEKELESLQQQLEQAQKELQEEKEKESDNPMVAALGKKGSQKFENLADAIASTQQSFGPQEQFLIALNLLKSVPNSQITKPGDVLKAIVEEARPALMKELLNMDHMALGTSKHRLAMAQKLITNIPEEDSALVADIVPEHIGKEMAVKVLGASATEEASGEVHGQAMGFDPNIDLSKKVKWSLMRRFIKKLNSTEVKNLFDELGQRARKAILVDLFDLQDPADLETCAEMIFVEPSIKAFVKGLNDEACELFVAQTALRIGQEKAVSIVAPDLQKIKAHRQSIVRHHEMVQTEFSCVSDEITLTKKPKEELFSDFMLTELPSTSRRHSAFSQGRSSTGIHFDGTKSEAMGGRHVSQAFGYRGARTEESLALHEQHEAERAEEATQEAEASAAEADKEKELAEAAKEAALAKERELAEELAAMKERMEQEMRAREAKMREDFQVEEGADTAAIASLVAHAKEEAQRAAEEKIKEKEKALKAAQEAAESQAAAFLERQQAALEAAELLAKREAEALAAKKKAEEEAAVAAARRRASDVAEEEAFRALQAAEAAKSAAQREREEAMEMKALYEQRTAEEEASREAAAQRQQEALERAERAAEAANAAKAELEARGDEVSDEEREQLKAKAAEEHAAKEAAETAAKEAMEAMQAAQLRAMETEKQMKEATINAHFQVLAKLSRVQAHCSHLEDRLVFQEEATAAAERRAKEAEDKEQQLCILVTAKALARQVRQRDRMAQTLLACEQNDEEQWRLSVDGGPADLQSVVQSDTTTLAAQYLADVRDDEDLQASIGMEALAAVKDLMRVKSPESLQVPPSPGSRGANPSRITLSAATQTDGEFAAVVQPSHGEVRPVRLGEGPSLSDVISQRSQRSLDSASSSRDVTLRESMEDFLADSTRRSPTPQEGSPQQNPLSRSEEPERPSSASQAPLGQRSDLRLPSKAFPRQDSKQNAGEGKPMTPSSSSASLPHTALPSQQLEESASSSTVLASGSQQQSTELSQEQPFPQSARGKHEARKHHHHHHHHHHHQPEHRSATDSLAQATGKRASLADLGFSPRGPAVVPSSKGSKGSKSPTSKRLLHLAGDGDIESSMEAVQVELQDATADPELEAKKASKKMALQIARKAAEAQKTPREAAMEAAEAVKQQMAEQGLSKEEGLEWAACCAGMAAAEAAVNLGLSPAEATQEATAEALAAALSFGFPNDLALQCASLAQGAVIGRAAARNKWTPSRAASCSAEVLKKFIDANEISYDHLIAMIAMASHEAAETVALEQGLQPNEAAIVGAEEAGRITNDLLQQKLRSLADVAVRAAGLEDEEVHHTISQIDFSPRTPRVEGSLSTSRPSTKGNEQDASHRVALPRIAKPLEDGTGSARWPRRSSQAGEKTPRVVRRISISELTLPAMAPDVTSRRPSQADPEIADVSPLPNEQYPDASRIMNYGSGRPTEVDRRASTYLQQMQERRASVSMRQVEPPKAPPASHPPAPSHVPTKPKLQGWQRVREKADRDNRRASQRLRTPPRGSRDGEASSGESRIRSSFVEHLQAQKKPQRPPPAPPAVAPPAPTSLAMAASRVMRLGMAVGQKVRRDAREDQPADAASALQDLMKNSSKQVGKLRKPDRRGGGAELRIDAAAPRPPEESFSFQRRSSQRYQPEARGVGQPFAPDVDALFVSAKQDAKGEDELSPKAPNKSPSLKANLSPNRQSREMEGKNFMGLASPGSTARSAEPDPTSIGDVLSVSQLSTEKSFYKVKDVPKAEDRKLDDGEDGEEMPMQRQPSVPMGPSVMPMGRKGEANEAELLVKRVCEGLDGKYGSVDAAFLNMSARFSRLDQPAGDETAEQKEDRTLLQLRSCLVESGVGHKDATLLLQAMRSELGGAMPTLQHVANSLRPGQLPESAVELAKKKGMFSFSGSDDPNINLESIRGISNLDARSILERPGLPVVPPPSSRGRNTSTAGGSRTGDSKRSESNSPSRSRSRSKAATARAE